MQKTTLLFSFLFLNVILFLSCSDEPQTKTPEIIRTTFEHDKLQREYIYYTPGNLKKDAPLVVVLHGFTSSAENIMDYSKMNEIALQNNFAVVYPQGTKDEKSNTFWNVGYEFHEDIKINDLSFIVKLVNHLQEKYNLSKINTFVTGMSNGGEMCYLLSCRYPEVFKAAAPVAGTMMNSFFENCNPSKTIPTLAIFGTEDNVTNYFGDDENKDGWGAYKSIPFILNHWTSMMKYDSIETDTLPDVVKTDSSFVVVKKYLDDARSPKFLYYEVKGGGHDWPGAWGNDDINASKEIWKFFDKQI